VYNREMPLILPPSRARLIWRLLQHGCLLLRELLAAASSDVVRWSSINLRLQPQQVALHAVWQV